MTSEKFLQKPVLSLLAPPPDQALPRGVSPPPTYDEKVSSFRAGGAVSIDMDLDVVGSPPDHSDTLTASYAAVQQVSWWWAFIRVKFQLLYPVPGSP